MRIKPIHLIGTAVAATLLVAGVKTLRAANNLVVLPALANLPRFEGISRMVVPLDTSMQNPTNGTLKFTFPHVQLLLGKTVLGTSPTRPEILEIGPNREVNLRAWLLEEKGEDFDLRVNLGSVLLVAPSLIGLATGGTQGIELTLRVTTTAFPVGLPLPDGKFIKVEVPIQIGQPNANG